MVTGEKEKRKRGWGKGGRRTKFEYHPRGNLSGNVPRLGTQFYPLVQLLLFTDHVSGNQQLLTRLARQVGDDAVQEAHLGGSSGAVGEDETKVVGTVGRSDINHLLAPPASSVSAFLSFTGLQETRPPSLGVDELVDRKAIKELLNNRMSWR